MSDSTDTRLIQHVTLRSFLSFGQDNPGIDLLPLNVFIGANGSGKSNLLEAISLMRSAPRDLQDVTRKGGGVTEWIWKGASIPIAEIEWIVKNIKGKAPLNHSIAFGSASQSFALRDERIRNEEPVSKRKPGIFYYQFNSGRAAIRENNGRMRPLLPDTTETNRSILAQRRDPEAYPELAWLAQQYERVRIYREWTFGRNAVFREPQKADMRNDTLEEDFSNLGLFLNRLKTRHPAAKKAILEGLKDLYAGITDFDVLIQGGTVQVFFTEGDFVIPATRLSDGTLRYLCLLAILCDPDPPPLICIEEPELGLHPDILPKVADLLRAASKRTQIIVTTHSDVLVDAMTSTPEAVVVCEKQQGQTTMERLNPDDLQVWLEKYRLGELWTRGSIGGTRW